jgi:hypothetical protein
MTEALPLQVAQDPSHRRISVIVPAYQAAPYLDAALASLAGQMRPADEVVVVDDASTDTTSAIALRWASVLPIVLVRNPTNLGLGATRKVGIERAAGELIALLDADDVLLPDHLAVLLEQWERHGGLVVAEGYRWVPERRLGGEPFTGRHVPPPEKQAERILTAHFGSYCSLFSREDYERAGGFREHRKSEDWEFFVRMIRTGTTMTVAPTPTLIYRRRPDSLSAGDGCVDANIELLSELLQQPLTPREQAQVQRTLRRFRARRLLLDGYHELAAGRAGAARQCWVRAAVLDRALRSGIPGMRASTTVRALASLVLPRSALGLRRRRLVDPKVLTA